MVFKSTCKACAHPHPESVCPATVSKRGSMTLRPQSNQLWGISGGMVKGYDSSTGNEQLSFKQFDTFRSEYFEYMQELDCGCRFYVPSDNLEFLEWKYLESTK